MRGILLLGLPLAAAVVAVLLPGRRSRARRAILPLAAIGHLALSLLVWTHGDDMPAVVAPWLGVDSLGLVFLTVTSGLFLPAALYAVGDMRRHNAAGLTAGVSERVYVAGLFCFLFAMTAVCMGQDMGTIWVAVEATTLATAPLIYYKNSPSALEATWKYLLVCSVGIALALLGVFLMAVAGSEVDAGTLRIRELAAAAPAMNPNLLKAAFIFVLVGYGAKMGLAPMHTWLPDAHSEAPSPVSALLSGTLLNGAFLAILRGVDIMQSAGLGEFAGGLLRLFGLLSMGVAGAFVLGQKDFKRLLAYSSVEHMGILAFAAGLGGGGVFAALLHAINHSFAKGCLFLTAGNIMFRYHSRSVLTVKGVRRGMPINGALWLAGFLAICGLPPFGLFFTEFAVVAESFAGGRRLEAALYLFFLAVVFIGMLGVFVSLLRGEPPPLAEDEKPESVWMAVPAAAALAVTLILGAGVFQPLSDRLLDAAAIIDESFVSMPGIRP